MRRTTYDIKEYPFKDIVSNWLDTRDLHKLHEIKQYEHFDREYDQSTKWHQMFYMMIGIDKTFNKVYMKFLTDVIKPRFNIESNHLTINTKIPFGIGGYYKIL